MTPGVVHFVEMLRRHQLTDAEVEAVLSGSTPAGRPGLEGLAELTAEIRRRADEAPAPRVTPLLATVLASGLGPIDKGDLPVTAGSNADGPAAQAAGLPKWRSASVISGLFESTVARIAAATLAVTAGLGGLGVAGALPGPVQDGFASVARTVGYHAPEDDDDVTDPAVDEDVDDPADEADDRGDEAEDRGDDAAGHRNDALARFYAGAAAAQRARDVAAWQSAVARNADHQDALASFRGFGSDDDEGTEVEDEAEDEDHDEIEAPDDETDDLDEADRSGPGAGDEDESHAGPGGGDEDESHSGPGGDD